MTADELRAGQAAIKNQYKSDPASAMVTLKSVGVVDREQLTCTIETPHGAIVSGLHKATGGDGTKACSGDMLLDALVACAGVTLSAVATAMRIELRKATITAEGDWDARGTLGISRDAPVGVSQVRLKFDLDTDAPAEQLDKLIELTERYCVILQTLKHPPEFKVGRAK